MQKISAGGAFFQKRIFPVLWFGGIFFMFGLQFYEGKQFNPFSLLVLLLMCGGGFAVMKHLIFDLVDEVWDDGDVLVVRNHGLEARIPLSNIINVNCATSNKSRITLMLREETVFGREISFMPPPRFLAFSMHPVAKGLIERVDRARKAR